MAKGYALPPPNPLEIHDSQAAENWKRFKLAWKNYALAIELNIFLLRNQKQCKSPRYLLSLEKKREKYIRRLRSARKKTKKSSLFWMNLRIASHERMYRSKDIDSTNECRSPGSRTSTTGPHWENWLKDAILRQSPWWDFERSFGIQNSSYKGQKKIMRV